MPYPCRLWRSLFTGSDPAFNLCDNVPIPANLNNLPVKIPRAAQKHFTSLNIQRQLDLIIAFVCRILLGDDERHTLSALICLVSPLLVCGIPEPSIPSPNSPIILFTWKYAVEKLLRAAWFNTALSRGSSPRTLNLPASSGLGARLPWS